MPYDAFISYSHSADDSLAPSLESALQRFARPWYKRRALRVFRDETALSVNPHLWASIVEAMDESRFFVLLASPAAASSPWVNRELEHWLATKSSETILLVLTEGTLAWDSATGAVNAAQTTALPATLTSVYEHEPRFIDARWTRDESHLNLRHGRFRNQIAAIAAPMHGVPQDELEGTDALLHRRTMRLAWAAGIALALLTCFSLAAAAAAAHQASVARGQRHSAQRNASIATDLARRLSTANANLSSTNSRLSSTIRALADKTTTLNTVNGVLASTNTRLSTTNTALANKTSALNAANGTLASTNTQLLSTNGKLQTETISLDNAQQGLIAANGQLSTANANLLGEERTLTSTNARLSAAQKATQAALVAARQAQSLTQQALDEAQSSRVAGVARQLEAESEAQPPSGAGDLALLLAAEAEHFASREGPTTDPILQRSLLDALQRNPRLVGYLQGLSGPTADTAVSQDGTRAAAVSLDGTVGVWNLGTRTLLTTFAVTPSDATHIRFVGANTIVVADDFQVAGYTTSNGRSWAHAWTSVVGDMELSIATSSDRIVTTAAGTSCACVIMTEIDASGAVLSQGPVDVAPSFIAFDPTSDHFATVQGLGGPGGSTLIDAHIFADPTHELAHFDADPSGQGAVDTRRIDDLAFSPDGADLSVALTGFGAAEVRFDVQSGHTIAITPGGSGDWSSIAPGMPIGVSPDGDAIVQRDQANQDVVDVGHIDDGVLVANLQSPVVPSTTFIGGGPSIDPLARPAFTPDGAAFLMPGSDGFVSIFDLSDAPRSHFAATTTVAMPGGYTADGEFDFSGNGALMATAADTNTIGRMVRVYTVDGSRPPVDIALPARANIQLTPYQQPFALDTAGDAIALVDADGGAHVYDPRTGSSLLDLPPIGNCPASTDPACQPEIDFQGSLAQGRIVVVDKAWVWSWDLHDGVVSTTRLFGGLTGNDGAGLARLSSDGNRMVVSTFSLQTRSGATHVLDATPTGWVERAAIPTVASVVGDEAISPDGSVFAVSDGGAHVELVDAATGAPRWTVPTTDVGTWFGPDDTVFTIARDGTIDERSTVDGQVLATLTPTTASGTLPEDVPDARPEVRTLVATGDQVVAVADTGLNSPTAMVTIWPLDPSVLVQSACSVADRNLTPAEWQQFVNNVDPYEKTCPAFP